MALTEAGAGPIVHSYAELETVLQEFLNSPSKMSA
jgi:phosphoglycolate phosphatase